ncbi:putative inactive patatin-like protein 9 [Hibiscus syriacus]|uniref:Inactive patatin-like protein 9 n=1 Tax=Hibiscus syriacus TaxID=106335 RepID=A0A6A3BF13_HIBSY|nr:putative inactive patatin-like protein 9 [Hibiscus syriacus]
MSHCETTNKIRILSINGGGTTDIVAGATLIHLEDHIRLKTGDPRAQIADFFDMIAGTIVGAIIAAMLSADNGTGHPLFTAREAIRFITQNNSKLFKVNKLAGVLHRQKRFSCKSMDKVLKETFRREDETDLTLKDTCKPLLVPCFDLKSSAPFVFSRADAFKSPSFFKPFPLTSVDGKTTCSAVDSGLVMNNPPPLQSRTYSITRGISRKSMAWRICWFCR